MERAKLVQITVLTTTLFGVVFSQGCHSTNSGPGGTAEQPVTAMLSGATGPGTGAVSQLDYFDALEKRSNVTWDELLAGVLMAAGRRADGTYADRLSTARKAAILGNQVPPSADSLATPGDMAKVLLRAQGIHLRDTITDQEALALASRRSLVPPTLNANDPLTGAVAVHALAAAGQPVGNAQKSAPAAPATKPPSGGSNP